jgi:hypothetical protein
MNIPEPYPIRKPPPDFDPTANFLQLQPPIQCETRLYTAVHAQTTENSPGTRPSRRFSVSISQDISRVFLIKITSPNPLQSLNLNVSTLPQTITYSHEIDKITYHSQPILKNPQPMQTQIYICTFDYF